MSLVRLQAAYENRSSSFYRKEQEFQKQFCHIYASRLENLGCLLKAKARDKFGERILQPMLQPAMLFLEWLNLIFLGSTYPFKKISELSEDSQETCIIIGTLFKDQSLKPSILKEISEDNQLVPLPPRSNYNDENDFLILEDELQRIRLEGKINVPTLVTGIICGVLGKLFLDVLKLHWSIDFELPCYSGRDRKCIIS